jgi:hypothetical protein
MSEKLDLPDGISIVDKKYRAELLIAAYLIYSSDHETLANAIQELENYKKIRDDLAIELATRN